MSQQPKVSVCLPVYNGDKFLAEAIESVLGQSFTDFELLIIDDCSTDNSKAIIKRFTEQDRRIRYVKNLNNLGLFSNYNACIKLSSGRFIKPFAQDDVLNPNILENMVDVLENMPDIALVSCARGWISAAGEVVEATNENALMTLKPFRQNKRVPAQEAILDSFQRLVNWLGEPCTVMFRSEHQDIGFDVRYKQIGDLEYWYRILKHGDYYFLSEELCKFRKHLGSTTNRNGRSLPALLDWFVLGSDYRHLIPKLNETEYEFCRRLSQRLMKTISSRYESCTENRKVNLSKVAQHIAGTDSLLSCFASEPGSTRDSTVEHKVFSICALTEGANFLNETRFTRGLIELQQTQIAALQTELEEVTAALNAETNELRVALSAMGNSASWRVTAPLRSVSKILK